MGDDDSRLVDIAKAVADGAPVDWAAEQRGMGSIPDDDLQAMQIIAKLAAAHRPVLAEESATSLGDVLSTVPPAASDHSRGVPWGPLLVLEEVGGGSFGRVYRAWDPSLDHEVALKRLRLPALTPASMAASIVQEGRLLAKIRHQNVVTVHGACEINGEVGIWMDFVRGRTLEQIVRDDGPMSAEEAGVVGESLCRAAAAVHQAGLLHRDIKASNVMREAGGRIVLLDFGSGTETELLGDGTARSVVGTALYMAPELFEGVAASVATDIYSLGVLLFFLTTGRHPVEGRSLDDIRTAHRAGRRQLLTDVRCDLPDAFVDVVERALSVPQPQRYPSAGSMLRALKMSAGDDAPAVRHSEALPVREQSNAASTQRIWWAMRVPAAVLAVVLALAAVGFITTEGFNLTFGRIGSFGVESWSSYVGWGYRALFPSAILMTLTAVTALALGFVIRLAVLIPPIGRIADRVGQRVRRLAAHVGLDQPDGLAQALTGLAVVTLVALCWMERELIGAWTSFFNTAPIESLLPMRDTDASGLYHVKFEISMLAFGYGLFKVIQLQQRTGSRDSVPAAYALAGIIAIMLLMDELPYRTFSHHDFERADLDGARCYIIGEIADSFLVLCPGSEPPRNRTIERGDAALRRYHQFESVFTPAEIGNHTH